ncbi:MULTISPECIES: hypothetical protein [Planktothricoides]|uniref:Uncharacterized protein n=1 Tax=Planktothricoides raciborskii FACHB-1370 TaxID=2949576 RepID=A0ABR8ECX8_9CYAN|nr:MULTISPECIES: hypothetical protein [Planktothricoides]KOR33801.1 hypothetical protein AM228_27720 [Planktothricoides sp. SR001]MBD2544355.1 hypothetical protein [Planktothricoides raciborskii FACHB-1370]MBD2582202.1 hypothetical protein [Planktothricoides raciborskii FACHB-1261]
MSHTQDNSPFSGDSQLDRLIQSLGIDLNSHSHSHTDATADSHNHSHNFLPQPDSVSHGLQAEPHQNFTNSETHYHPHFQNHPNSLDLGSHHSGFDQYIGQNHLSELAHHHLTEGLNHTPEPFYHSPETALDHPLTQADQPTDLTDLIHTQNYHQEYHHQEHHQQYNQEHLASHHHGETATNSPWEHQQQTLNYTSSGAITEQDDNAVYFDGNNVWWHGTGWGKAGTVDGHKYYRGDKYIGRLGADLNVYNSDGNKIGYVTPSGCAYSTNGKLFATGSTVRWAAATLVFNTCTQ